MTVSFKDEVLRIDQEKPGLIERFKSDFGSDDVMLLIYFGIGCLMNEVDHVIMPADLDDLSLDVLKYNLVLAVLDVGCFGIANTSYSGIGKTIEEALDAVDLEVRTTRIKYPSNSLLSLALIEEFGELARALIDCELVAAPGERVYAEAIQVAAMIVRVAEEAVVLEG
jgi:hypothetical protein